MNSDARADLVRRLVQDSSDASIARRLFSEAQLGVARAPDARSVSRSEIAGMIDHTILRPDTTMADVRRVCDEARKHCFAAACIAPCYVRHAAAWLNGSGVAVCTVVGFPLGANRTAVKVAETEGALRDGASEIDMVIGIGWLKGGQYNKVERDLRAVVDQAHAVAGPEVVVKAILETTLLTDREKVVGSLLAEYAGADFIKTSTGFAGGGATAKDVALIRRTVAPGTGIKASGGIHTFEDASILIRRGATRLGASGSTNIVGE